MKANNTKGFERLDNVITIVKAITTITIHKKCYKSVKIFKLYPRLLLPLIIAYLLTEMFKTKQKRLRNKPNLYQQVTTIAN